MSALDPLHKPLKVLVTGPDSFISMQTAQKYLERGGVVAVIDHINE